jgi:hypothetical protein
MPECQCRTEENVTRRNSDTKRTFFRHSGIPVFQHHMARISPSTAGYRTSLSIASSMDVQDVPVSITSSMDLWHPSHTSSANVQGVSQSMASSVVLQGVYVTLFIAMNKMPMTEPSRYRNKGTQSGTGLRYRMPEFRCRWHCLNGRDADA